MTAAKQMTRQ